jgi:hypothetical protein
MASPREDSTGGKHKLGPISKRGDQYPRRISLVGAHATSKSNAGRSKLYEGCDRRPDPGHCLRGDCSLVASGQTALAMTG